MNYAIFDLDNCLSDDRARIPLIRWGEANPDLRYAEYHAGCGDDPIGNWAKFAAVTEARGLRPVFMTARPADVQQQTLLWIEERLGVERPILLMRNCGDRRRSVDVKQEQLSWLRHWDIDINAVSIAYDDHPDIVQMYRDNGIHAEQLRIHDLDAYNPPSLSAPSEEEMLRAIAAPDARVVGERFELGLGEELRLAAATFDERTREYGTLYKDLARVYELLYPEGLTLSTEGDFARFSVLNHCLNKLARYARSLPSGGHADSAHDLITYAAMLKEVTK